MKINTTNTANKKLQLQKSRKRFGSVSKRYQTTVGRFTTDVENFHGRMAMVGLVGTTFGEEFYKTPIVQQFVSETGIPSIDLFAFVVVVTSLFILESVSPKTERREETELDVFSNPGFTLETEILHGRMAMLAFTYSTLYEQLYSKLSLYYDLSTWHI
jgi:hypothetical protein